MRTSAQVGRHRELADIEVETPYHPAEGCDDGRDLFEIEVESVRLHRAVLERLGVSARRQRGLQSFGHTIHVIVQPQ